MELKKIYIVLISVTHSILGIPQDVTQWRLATKNIAPGNKSTGELITAKDFDRYLSEYIEEQKNTMETASWVGNKLSLESEFLDNSSTIRPVVAKYTVSDGDHLFFWGDLHGDVQSLSLTLYKLYKDAVIDNSFKIQNEKCHFFFLGDLVDRGEHGPETLTLLFILALKNPNQVHLLRGNHEDIRINEQYGESGFSQQIFNLTRDTPDSFKPLLLKVTNLYNLLPVAAFVGHNNNYFQCCHGGLEARYNPQALLSSPHKFCLEAISKLEMSADIWNPSNKYFSCTKLNINREATRYNSWYAPLKIINLTTSNLGFLWNDFRAVPIGITNNTDQTTFTPGRGLMLGKTFTEAILNSYSKNNIHVRGVIRGHQHNDSMPGLFEHQNTGLYSLWNNKVITTINTGYYIGAPAFIELIVKENFDDWILISNNFQKDGLHTKKDLLKDWKNEKN